MTPTVLLAVKWPDGTGCMMTRDEFLAHDWIARPGTVRLVNIEDELRRQCGKAVH